MKERTMMKVKEMPKFFMSIIIIISAKFDIICADSFLFYSQRKVMEALL